MIEEITSSIIKNEKYTVLPAKLDRIAANCCISDSGKFEALIFGLNNAVSQFLEDGLLSEEEEQRLENFKDHFDLSIAELNANGSWTKLVKAAILRNLFEGKTPQRVEILDTGLLGITNKHIYFSGSKKSFRAQYNKIVSFTPYDDGIGIHREAASAKPQILVTGDGWFSYNLISNLVRCRMRL